MQTVTKRIKCTVIVVSPMLDTIDKLTEPIACSLLDGTRINVELCDTLGF
jgi:hypothetical protein